MRPITDGAVPPPGRHGGDAPRIAAALGWDPADMLDLSLSLNPFAAPIDDLAAGSLSALRQYPDPTAARDLLASAMGVDADRMVLTNGGSEAIDLVARAVGGRVEEPEFGLYPRGGGPLWRSDPHSPTGRLRAGSEQADVWDEAFYPLAAGTWSAGREETTVGSLTKLFACPGLRLGYVLSDDADRLRALQPTWSVNGLALAVLPALLAAADLDGWHRRIGEQRERLARVFIESGRDVIAHDAPWILVRDPTLRDRLAQRGVVVRGCASFGLPDTVRVAVPSDEGFERVVAALDAAEDGVRRS